MNQLKIEISNQKRWRLENPSELNSL